MPSVIQVLDRCMTMCYDGGRVETEADTRERIMAEKTIYTVSDETGCWGDVTPEQAHALAVKMVAFLTRHCSVMGIENVEFRIVPEQMSLSNQPSGDESVIDDLDDETAALWERLDEWAPEVLSGLE